MSMPLTFFQETIAVSEFWKRKNIFGAIIVSKEKSNIHRGLQLQS